MKPARKLLDMFGNPVRTSAARVQSYHEAAQYSRSRSYLALGPDDVNASNTSDRPELLRKARYWDQNSPLVNRLADLFVNHVVGTGLRVTPASMDEAWNTIANDWWLQWEQFADLTSRFTWPTLQRLMARELIIAGEYFILLTSSTETGRNRIQFVQPHQIKTPPSEDGNPLVIDGVEVNSFGRPIAYYIATQDRNGKETFARHEARWVIHGFDPQRPQQVRGLTMFSPVLNDIHDLEDLQQLEQQAARDNAQVTKVIKTESGELDDEDALVTGDVNSLDRTTYYRRAFGSSAEVMMQGDDMKEFRSDRPSVAEREYWVWLVNKVCAGVNIPSQLVFPESLNGTVTRAVLDLANAHFRGYTILIASSIQRVWNYVIGNQVSGDLKGAPDDWGKITVHPPRAVNVDVGRNSTAMINEHRAGMRTLQSIYAETGQDWRQELQQKAVELAYASRVADENGLKPSDLLDSIEPAAEPESRPVIEDEEDL